MKKNEKKEKNSFLFHRNHAIINFEWRKAVPEAKGALDRFKMEVAQEIGVPLKEGYNGDLTSKQNGSVGGYMVKKMIEAQERQMTNGTSQF